MRRSIRLAFWTVTAGAIAASAAIAALATEGGRTYTVSLEGEVEVPPGDLDGTGTAEITVNVPQRRVCYELTVSGIDPATAAHIHPGAAGTTGPPLITLEAPTDGSSSGCVDDLDAQLVAQLLARPYEYYVNVHNATHPPGAVRGQLAARPGNSD